MAYEVDNTGRTNEVHRVTTPAPAQRDTAAVPQGEVIIADGKVIGVRVRTEAVPEDFGAKKTPREAVSINSDTNKRYSIQMGGPNAGQVIVERTDGATSEPVITDALDTARTQEGYRVTRDAIGDETLVTINGVT